VVLLGSVGRWVVAECAARGGEDAFVNDHVVRVSVLTESFFWHFHPNSDESFWAVEGYGDSEDGLNLAFGLFSAIYSRHDDGWQERQKKSAGAACYHPNEVYGYNIQKD
jgi:hypothetical protein